MFLLNVIIFFCYLRISPNLRYLFLKVSSNSLTNLGLPLVTYLNRRWTFKWFILQYDQEGWLSHLGSWWNGRSFLLPFPLQNLLFEKRKRMNESNKQMTRFFQQAIYRIFSMSWKFIPGCVSSVQCFKSWLIRQTRLSG